MGKNLKGKDCGRGIYQRKDGLYHARYADKTGRTHSKYFKTLPEARNWLADEKYEQRHGTVPVEASGTDMTVDAWFEFWITNIVGNLAPNTRRNYRERYVRNIQPVIGRMLLTEVKPMHCKVVFNQIDSDYTKATIRQTYIAMRTMFRSALMNDLITKHPMDGETFAQLSAVRVDTGNRTSDRQDDRSDLGCSRRCLRSFWVMPALRQPWTGLFNCVDCRNAGSKKPVNIGNLRR